jgi:hypothetical protein
MTTVENLGQTMFEIGRNGNTEPEKPIGTVVDPETLTREQLLDAVRGHYVVRLHDAGTTNMFTSSQLIKKLLAKETGEEEQERFSVVTIHSIELGEFGFAEDDHDESSED